MPRYNKSLGPLKQCSESKGCGQWKTLENFYKRSDINAYRSQCIDCSIAKDLKYYYTCVEQRSVYKANYYKSKKDKISSRNSNWKKNNKDKVALQRQKRRLTEANVDDGTITSESWQSLCDFYGHKCLCCGSQDVKLTLDHIIPIAKGGHHSINNIQPLCRSCNSKKHAKIVDYRHKSYPIIK